MPGVPMIVVALAGLVANATWSAAAAQSKDSLAVKGAYMEVVADTVGSIGVLIAGVVTVTTHGRTPTSWSPSWSRCGCCRGHLAGPPALRILSESSPTHIDVDELRTALAPSTASPRYTICMCGRWCPARTWSPRT